MLIIWVLITIHKNLMIKGIKFNLFRLLNNNKKGD